MRRRIIIGTAIAAASWLAAFFATRQWSKTWAWCPTTTKPLPGDDLVPHTQASDTRGITIEAAPNSGRGSCRWATHAALYSVDQIDSAHEDCESDCRRMAGPGGRRHPATYPGGGFQVKLLDPNRSLVPYGDPSTMQQPSDAERQELPAGLAGLDTFLAQTERVQSVVSACWSRSARTARG